MDWGKFFAMGGYGFYVWGSYIVTAIVMLGELVLLHHRRRSLERREEQ
jgi:heme exporter protein D